MNVDWAGYQPFDPGVTQPLHELTKREAREAFGRLMRAKSERVDALRRLLAGNGVDLGSDDASLQVLNDWFRASVAGDPATDRLLPRWYSVVNDLALFLGDVIIERAPNVSWVMFDRGARDVAFQRHVLMGFSGVANPKYNVDIDRLLATYAHRIVAGEQVEVDAFLSWVNGAAAKA